MLCCGSLLSCCCDECLEKLHKATFVYPDELEHGFAPLLNQDLFLSCSKLVIRRYRVEKKPSWTTERVRLLVTSFPHLPCLRFISFSVLNLEPEVWTVIFMNFLWI